jgi:signal transduction histidine kinase
MRRRLLVGFLLFAIAITVALEVPLGFITASRVRGAEQRSLQRSGKDFALVVSDALRHHEPDRVRVVGSEFVKGSHDELLVVEGSTVLLSTKGDGASFAHSPVVAKMLHDATRTQRGGESDFPRLGETLWTIERVSAGDKNTSADSAVVLVSEPASVVAHATDDDWLRLGLLGAAVLLAATVLALLLAESLTRPLRRIASAVTTIGEGELSARAPADVGPGELRELGSAVNATADRLSRLLESQRAFAANASHQLRTPLTAIRLRLEHAQRLANPEAAAELKVALDEMGRLSKMINALLELAREEDRQVPREVIDVTTVIDERIRAWRPLADEQGLSLDIGLAPADGMAGNGSHALNVRASPEILEQVLDNLLANAFDATPPGGSVRVYAERTGSVAEIHVVDDGRGLSPGEHERAFDRFWRGKQSGNGGSGLGLAIVDHLVRSSGGSAELRGRVEGGTDAVVRVPAA